MLVSNSLNVINVIYSWITHIAKERASMCSRELAFYTVSFGGGPAWWGDDSMRTMEEEGGQRYQQTWEGGGERKKNETRENQGKSERLQWQAFFQATGKFSGSDEKEKRSMGRWRYLAVGLYFHLLLGMLLSWSWSSCVQLLREVLRHSHHIRLHISAGRVRKGGKLTNLLVILYFSQCVVIVYMPTSLSS